MKSLRFIEKFDNGPVKIVHTKKGWDITFYVGNSGAEKKGFGKNLNEAIREAIKNWPAAKQQWYKSNENFKRKHKEVD